MKDEYVDMDEVPQIQPMRAGVPLTRISLGDLTQRVAVYMHEEMVQMNIALANMDKELRTIRLRSWVAKSIKKLTQLYAIIRWAHSPAPPALMEALATLHTQVSTIDAQLAEIQDRYYWSHATMYCMRSRPLEVGLACDVLSTGSYPYLPEAIFSCGKTLQPGTDFVKNATAADKAALTEELNTFIRAKLALHDSIPSEADEASVQNGYLKLKVDHMWEVTASLDHLSEKAAWVILQAKILVGSHPDELFPGGFDHETLERDLLYLLRKHAAAARDFALKEEEDAKQIQEDTVVKSEEDQGPEHAAPAHGPPTPTRRVFTLAHLQALSSHLALAAAQRFFYVQACDLARTIWHNKLEAQYIEEIDANHCTFRFWRCEFTGLHQFQVRISQLRSSRQTDWVKSQGSLNRLGEPLRCELHAIQPSEVEGMPDVLSAVPRFSETKGVRVQEHIINGGVTFRRFFDHTLYALAQCKLELLHCRMRRDPAVAKAMQLYGLRLRRGAAAVSLTFGNFQLDFGVEAQTGDYTCVVIAYSSKSDATRSKPPSLLTSIQRLEAEINNLETQRALRVLCAEHGLDNSGDESIIQSFVEGQRVASLANTEQLMMQIIVASVEYEWYLKPAVDPVGIELSSATLRSLRSSTVLTPAILAEMGIPAESATAQFQLCSYASVDLVGSHHPASAKLNCDAKTATEAVLVSGSVSKEDAQNIDGLEAYRASIADMGLFVVLSTDKTLETRAHALLVKIAPAALDGQAVAPSFVPRKKAKKSKLLTAGQLAALKAKEAEEAEAEARRLGEYRRNANAGAAKIKTLEMRILQAQVVPGWLISAPINSSAKDEPWAGKYENLSSHADSLMKFMQSCAERWVRRPISLQNIEGIESMGKVNFGHMEASCAVNVRYNRFDIAYGFQELKELVVARLSFHSDVTGQVKPLLEGVHCPRHQEGDSSDFYVIACEIARHAVNALSERRDTYDDSRLPIQLPSIGTGRNAGALRSTFRFIATTIPLLHVLWTTLKRMESILPPEARPFKAVSSCAAGAPSSVQPMLTSICFLKPVAVVELDSIIALQCSSHRRTFVDDGFGTVKILREEMGGVVNVSPTAYDSELTSSPTWNISCAAGQIAEFQASPQTVNDMDGIARLIIEKQE